MNGLKQWLLCCEALWGISFTHSLTFVSLLLPLCVYVCICVCTYASVCVRARTCAGQATLNALQESQASGVFWSLRDM